MRQSSQWCFSLRLLPGSSSKTCQAGQGGWLIYEPKRSVKVAPLGNDEGVLW